MRLCVQNKNMNYTTSAWVLNRIKFIYSSPFHKSINKFDSKFSFLPRAIAGAWPLITFKRKRSFFLLSILYSYCYSTWCRHFLVLAFGATWIYDEVLLSDWKTSVWRTPYHILPFICFVLQGLLFLLLLRCLLDKVFAKIKLW